MVIQIITTIFHGLWCYLFVHYLDMNIRGTALAYSITQVLTFVILCTYISRLEKLKEAIFWPNKESFTGLWDYLKIGILAACITSLEWSSFEYMTLMAGFLGISQTGAQGVLFNFECVIYMPALGL
jgi:Na+-driven multidrug efflux pump